MAVFVRLINGKYRIVEGQTGNIATTRQSGAPLDGGGHQSMEKAIRQAAHINIATEPLQTMLREMEKPEKL